MDILFPQKEGSGFPATITPAKLIPIEVGIGKKVKSQIKKAILTYNSDYDLVISRDRLKVTMHDI